jgi:hypothetical protein
MSFHFDTLISNLKKKSIIFTLVVTLQCLPRLKIKNKMYYKKKKTKTNEKPLQVFFFLFLLLNDQARVTNILRLQSI